MATTAQNPTYFQLISQDEKAAKTEQLKLKAQEAGLEVSKELFALNSELAKSKSELAACKKRIPYSVLSEYNVSKRITDLEEKIKFVTAIRDERFSDATI